MIIFYNVLYLQFDKDILKTWQKIFNIPFNLDFGNVAWKVRSLNQQGKNNYALSNCSEITLS